MDIAAYTMTLQTNCRDQTFVSIVTFRELQSVSVMDAPVLSDMTSKIWADFAKD
jgi:hypothetical protein